MTEDELRARMKEKIANFDWDAWSRADLQAAFKSETEHLIETIERLTKERDEAVGALGFARKVHDENIILQKKADTADRLRMERDLLRNTVSEMQVKLDKGNGRITLEEMRERIAMVRKERENILGGPGRVYVPPQEEA